MISEENSEFAMSGISMGNDKWPAKIEIKDRTNYKGFFDPPFMIVDSLGTG